MQSRLPQGLELCSFYNKKTYRCRIDGTSWCAFPKANYCELAAGETAKKHGIPTVILEIQRELLQKA